MVKPYVWVSLETLSEMFDLDYKTTHSLVSKMILSEELSGMCDGPTKVGPVQA